MRPRDKWKSTGLNPHDLPYSTRFEVEDLKTVMTGDGSPSEAWKAIDDWFHPQIPG